MLLVMFFWLFIYVHVEPHLLTVKDIEIKNICIPQEFDGKKIVFITDIHHGPNFSVKRLRNLVKTTNDLKPDIILLGGDYTSGTTYIDECFSELNELNAPLGKYGVLGNHDHWNNARKTYECMKLTNIKSMDNYSEWITLNQSRIKIGGVGDLWTDTQEIQKTIGDVKKDDFVILLSHNPDYAEKLGGLGSKINLMLCGHTHGGQVTFFCFYAPRLPSSYGQKYCSGIVFNGSTEIIISKGVGCLSPAIRFFCYPDIISLTLRHDKNK